MNQYFLDELKCITSDLSKKKCRPAYYCGNEINIVCDEHGLAAYLAGFNMMVSKPEKCGKVNIITEGECRNKTLYDEIVSEFGENAEFHIYSSLQEYLEQSSHEGYRRFYYIANTQLDCYKDPEFLKKKKENLDSWITVSENFDGRFIFIPIFNFSKPIPEGIAACSEREIDALSNYDESFVNERILIELEDICRAHFNKKEQYMKIVRFDNVFGPLVEDTTKLGIGNIINELVKENKITFRRSDANIFYTGCYIRQAVTAVHIVDLKGKTGNIYNAANYRFTLHDIKNNLYKSFPEKKPEVTFVDDLPADVSSESVYECLGNFKIKGIGWSISTPLLEGIYRTTLAKMDEEYKAGFYVSIYQGKLDRIKKIEMDIIREIDRICKKHDIPYFLVGGSLLGAIRHEGFIPWDDDIDICMFREDYEKFRKVCPGELSPLMQYQSYKHEPDSHYIFDKIRLKDTYFNTKFSNRFRNMENGIFVDVLVYDRTSNSAFGQKLHIKLIKIFRRLINVRWVNVARKGIHYRASKLFLPLMRLVPFNFFHFCFERALQMFNHKKSSKYLIDGVGQNLERGAFPVSWFDEMVEVPYEDMMFRVPKEYDAYLRHWYGDRYMELLPISSRNSGHKLLRLDLGKYLFEETEDTTAHTNHLLGELYEEPIYN